VTDSEDREAVRRAREAGQKLREVTALLNTKREAYGIVAALIAESRSRMSEARDPPTLALLRELEVIETAMRNASKVNP
jgi:hypothetical protein